MQGILVISSSSQLLLSSRLSAQAKHLAALTLDALSTAAHQERAVIWLPGIPTNLNNDKSQRRRSSSQSKRIKRQHRTARSESDYSESDSDGPSTSSASSSSNNDVEDVDDLVQEAAVAWNDGKLAAEDAHSGSCCCLARKNDLIFAIPVMSDMSPIIPFAFLDSLIALLQDYFGNVTEASLKDSFDVVLQILEETLSAPQAVLTDASALRELVPPPSLYAKVVNAATSALSASANASNIASIAEARQVLASPIPWRRQGLRYQYQEVYMDVVEEIGGIVDVNGNLMVAEVRGILEAKCKLTGMPDLTMTLTSADLLQDCCFHPCVRLAKWSANKVISFVPPDGRFILMEYRLASPTSEDVIPLSVKPVVTTGKSGGAFHWTISSRNPPTKPLENIKLTLNIGKHASNVQAVLSGGRSSAPRDDDEPVSGRWDFDAVHGNLSWRIASLSSSEQPIIFQGTWNSSISPCPTTANAVSASFRASVINVSGIQISSLKIASPEAGAPYKGSRPMMRSGKLEFRVR